MKSSYIAPAVTKTVTLPSAYLDDLNIPVSGTTEPIWSDSKKEVIDEDSLWQDMD